MADNGCFAETSGRVLGKGLSSRDCVFRKVLRCGGRGCMNPARRAINGFIWSVRLSEAKPSRSSRALALNILCRAKILVTIGGPLLASEIWACQQGHSGRKIIRNLIQKGTNAETS